VLAYDGVNEIGRTELYSYESTVYYSTSVRGGKYLVKVKDPDGNEQTLERFDANLLSPVLADDEYIDYTNETIKITVYTGLFGIDYSIWDE